LKKVSMNASLERSALARLPHSRPALPRTGNHRLYGIAVRLAAPTIALGVPGAMPRTTGTVDHQDLAVIGGLNVGVVALVLSRIPGVQPGQGGQPVPDISR
jgi:hypothetical protein